MPKKLTQAEKPVFFRSPRILAALVGERDPAKPERLKNPWAMPISPREERKRYLGKGRGAERGQDAENEKSPVR